MLAIIIIIVFITSSSAQVIVQRIDVPEYNLEYALLDVSLDFDRARSTCSSLEDFPDATLIKPRTDSQQSPLANLVGTESHWLNFKRENSSLSGEEPASYGVLEDELGFVRSTTPWSSGHPTENKFTLCISRTSVWKESSCGVKRKVICQKSKDIKPIGSFGNKQYFLLDSEQAQFNSKVSCLSLEQEGVINPSLLLVTSVEENDHLFEVLKPFFLKTGFSIWLGIERKFGLENTPSAAFGISTEFGNLSSSFPWGDNHPFSNLNCAVFTAPTGMTEYTWDSIGCTSFNRVLCQGIVSTSTTQTPTKEEEESDISEKTEDDEATNEVNNGAFGVGIAMLFFLISFFVVLIFKQRKFMKYQQKLIERLQQQPQQEDR